MSVNIDNERVRQLARAERDGGCADASEGGRRIAWALGSAFQNGEAEAWGSLLGLAAQGAAYYMRSVLKENRIKVRRRGNVVTISGGYAVPQSVAQNGVSPSAAVAADRGDGNLYVQFDFMTWAEFHLVLDALRGRRGSLDATIVTFEEIAKLEAQYPRAHVGEAIQQAGLDLSSRHIDLDSLRKII